MSFQDTAARASGGSAFRPIEQRREDAPHQVLPEALMSEVIMMSKLGNCTGGLRQPQRDMAGHHRGQVAVHHADEVETRDDRPHAQETVHPHSLLRAFADSLSQRLRSPDIDKMMPRQTPPSTRQRAGVDSCACGLA